MRWTIVTPSTGTHIVYTQHYVSWDMEISVTKVSGNVELVEKICPLWLTLCTLCYVWSWAWILFGRNHAHEMFDHKCVLVGWLGRPLHCTVSHANFLFAMMQYLDWRHRSGAWVSWLKYLLLWENDRIKIEMKSWKWRGSKKLHLMLVLAGQWTWYQPDKCQTAAAPLGTTRYPYHGHHQSEIKHLSGHSFTRPRHWRLGTSG